MTYTQDELNEFRMLIEAGESKYQLDRIRSRFDMPAFIKRVGRDKCDAMFEVLKAELVMPNFQGQRAAEPSAAPQSWTTDARKG